MKKISGNHSGTVGGGMLAPKTGSCHGVSGLSLVELIFAVILLTIVVFGIIKLQTSNLTLTNTQKNELKANFLANEGAEIAEAIGKSGIDAECGSPPCTCRITSTSGYSLDCAGGGFETLDDLFERTVEIDPTGLTSAYKVTILIQWTDSSGDHRRDSDTDGDGKPDNAQIEAKRIIF
jgi:Tfp pilus assembly protein PilV